MCVLSKVLVKVLLVSTYKYELVTLMSRLIKSSRIKVLVYSHTTYPYNNMLSMNWLL